MDNRIKAVRLAVTCQSMLYDKRSGDCSQLYRLFDLATMAPDGSAVECGVYRGGSLVCWAAARYKRGPIIAVDYKFREGFHRHIALARLHPRLVQGRSWEVAGQIEGEVAFCFIDGDHGEPFCRDIAAWPDKIMPGGIIAFHDYGVWKPSVVVKREVDRWQSATQWEPLGIVGSLIAFRRPV